jgi:branched-chain amino acid transport system substrate-binding protein
VLAVLGLALAACSSGNASPGGSSAATGSATSPAAAATTAATGTPLRLGFLCDCGSSIAALNGEQFGKLGIGAWADWVNAHGGVSGHPVQLFTGDTNSDPAKAVSLAQNMVQNDHVIAFVGNATGTTDSALAQYLDKAKIPVIGGADGSDTTWITAPYFFKVGTTIDAVLYGGLQVPQVLYKAKTAAVIYCVESPICAAIVPTMKKISSSLGMSMPYIQGVSSTAPNYTAQCVAMQKDGVQTVYIAADSSRIATSCHSVGFTSLHIVLPAGAMNTVAIGEPDLTGSAGPQEDMPYAYHGPAAATFWAAMNQYAFSKVSSPQGQPSHMVASWVSGLVLAKAVSLLPDPANPTSAGIVTALRSFRGYTAGGMAPPLSWSNPTDHSIKCYFVEGLENGKLTAPAGLKTYCSP